MQHAGGMQAETACGLGMTISFDMHTEGSDLGAFQSLDQ